MKVLKVEKCITLYIETDDLSFGGDYRRGEHGGWEQRIGESWEPCWDDVGLEAAFQEFVETPMLSEEGLLCQFL